MRRLVGDLREGGIDARSELTHLRPGQDLWRFMEQADECDRVLVICTQNYMARADGRVGGVGYEHLFTAANLVRDPGSMRFVPALRDTADRAHLPRNLKGRVYVNLSPDGNYQAR